MKKKIWNFCEGYLNEGVTYCSEPKTFYWFNPVEVLVSGLLAGATIALPAEVATILELLRLGSRLMYAFFTAGTVINFVLFRKQVTRYMLAAILATCIGVSFTINEAAKTQLFGVIIATLAFCSTALYQIWIGKKIEDFAVSPPQLLLNQAPISVCLLIPFVPFFEWRT